MHLLFMYNHGADVAEITVSDFDISDHTIGETFAVLCSVESCLPDITVNLLRGQEDRGASIVADAETMVAQFNLNVTVDVVGEYTCMVSADFMGMAMTFTRNFNITGKP